MVILQGRRVYWILELEYPCPLNWHFIDFHWDSILHIDLFFAIGFLPYQFEHSGTDSINTINEIVVVAAAIIFRN